MGPFAILFAAPHRLGFLVGSVNLAGLAAWWLLQLAGLHLGTPSLPQGDLSPALLHGPVMLFLIFPPFVMGFLLTVFPRWMGYPDLSPRQFGPVAALLAAGALTCHAGLWSGKEGLVFTGFILIALGWALAIFNLALIVHANRRDGRAICWHAISALGALALGLCSLAASAGFVAVYDSSLWRLGNQLGLTGFLLPIFLTVAHRMVPFFAGNAVRGYEPWRPTWLLAALWLFLLAKLASDLSGFTLTSAMASAGLAAITALMAWKWWPKAPAPGLLKVLLWGFAWAPAGFVMSALAQSGVPLGRGPDHALLIGFSGSLVVAMVTRVTHGHSGRPLEMPALAWAAFAAIQVTAVLRVWAAAADENGVILVIAAMTFLLGLLPWTMRNALIYLRRRIDGRPG